MKKIRRILAMAGVILILSAVILLAVGIILDSIKNQTLQILEEVLNSYDR